MMSKTVLDLLHSLGVEDRISGEFVSKYTVFSHKGGVRTLADNPHAHTHARVILLWSFVLLFI